MGVEVVAELDAAAAVASGLGARLRAAREARRATLQELADATSLTKGFLSKVERGVATPSVASLLRLCDALELSIGEVFGEEADGSLVRRGAYPPLSFGGIGLRESLLTPSRERRLQVIHSVVAPGGGSGDERYELPVDVEFVLVLDGALDLTLDDTVHRLEAGDAMTFPPDVPHAFANPTERETTVLWVLAPALLGQARPSALG